MPIVTVPFYNILAAYRPVAWETSVLVDSSLYTPISAEVLIFKNAVLLVTTVYNLDNIQPAIFPNVTAYFKIDIQKFCQDSIAPNTPLPSVFCASGVGFVVNTDAYADYEIGVVYKAIDLATGLIVTVGVPDVTIAVTVFSTTRQHTELMDLFYYYGTLGFQDGHYLTNSARTLDVCEDENIYLSAITPYSLTPISGCGVGLFDAAGNLLDFGASLTLGIPTLSNQISQNVNINSLAALVYQIGTPNFANPLISYYKVNWGVLFEYSPGLWSYVEHTETFTYNLIPSCCDTRSLRLHWLNLLGGVDSYTFNSEKDLQIKTNSDRAMKALNWVIGSQFPNDINDVGSFKYNSKASKAYQLSSRFLTNDEAFWLSELLVSPKVYAEIDNSLVPVIIEDKEQSITRHNGKIRFEIAATLANNVSIQRV